MVGCGFYLAHDYGEVSGLMFLRAISLTLGEIDEPKLTEIREIVRAVGRLTLRLIDRPREATKSGSSIY